MEAMNSCPYLGYQERPCGSRKPRKYPWRDDPVVDAETAREVVSLAIVFLCL